MNFLKELAMTLKFSVSKGRSPEIQNLFFNLRVFLKEALLFSFFFLGGEDPT